MTEDLGVAATPPGMRPFGVEPPAASQAEPLVPSAEKVIARALEPLKRGDIPFVAHRALVESLPATIMERLWEAGYMLRERSQADWPVVVRVSRHPFREWERLARYQITIGSQTYGTEQNLPCADYVKESGFAYTMAKVAVRAATEHVLQATTENAALQFSKAIREPSEESSVDR